MSNFGKNFCCTPRYKWQTWSTKFGSSEISSTKSRPAASMLQIDEDRDLSFGVRTNIFRSKYWSRLRTPSAPKISKYDIVLRNCVQIYAYYCVSKIEFLTTIFHRGLRNDFFSQPIYLLFPISIWSFISLFSLDFYFTFLFGLLFSLFSLDFYFSLIFFRLLFNRGHILDFFHFFIPSCNFKQEEAPRLDLFLELKLLK